MLGCGSTCCEQKPRSTATQHCHALLPHYSPSKVLAAQVDRLRALGVLQAVRSTTWSTAPPQQADSRCW